MSEQKMLGQKNKEEEYIKMEIMLHKKGLVQEDVIAYIRDAVRLNAGDKQISVKEIAVTGIEGTNEDSEFDEFMNATVGCESLDEGQDIIAQKFFEKHPMWFVVTMSCMWNSKQRFPLQKMRL